MRDDGTVQVDDVKTRRDGDVWRDDTLAEHLLEITRSPDGSLGEDTAIAIDAPLTAPACGRCVLPACPGANACVDPVVVWMRNEGVSLATDEAEAGAEVVGPGARIVTT